MTEPNEGTADQQRGQEAVLSRNLADSLIELSIALHKHAMYPEGHPSLRPAAESVAQKLDDLLERGTLSLGVARNQLVIEGIATDPKNPVLKDLASRMHRHQIGAVAFKRGATADEIQDLLRLVAVDADRAGQPLGLGPSEELSRWPHITLYPVTYEALQLLDDEGEEQEGEEDAGSRTRAAQLWIGLARAALLAEGLEDDDGVETPSTEPSVIAEAIDKRKGGSAYDQVIVGYLLKIADELRTAQTSESAALRKRMSQLISKLSRPTLKRLVAMGGDRSQRHQFLLNASEGMAVDAVIDLVQAAGEAEEQNISHSVLRMMQKLANHAEGGHGKRQSAAEQSVRESLNSLVKGWSLNDPNPDQYTQALQQMSTSTSVFAVAPEMVFKPEPRRMFQMALEVDAMGEAVKRAVDALITVGELHWVLDTLQKADAPKLTAGLWDHVGGVEQISAVLHAEPLDPDALDLLLGRVGIQAAEPMLDVLAESESRQTRRTLLDRLVGFESPIGPFAEKRLTDPRWYVLRNMLVILGNIPRLPTRFNPSEYLKHEDPRVRREAVQVAIKMPEHHDRAVCSALADPDPGIERIGMAAATDACPKAAISILIQKVMSSKSPELKEMAVRILGTSDQRAAVEGLLLVASPKKTLFRTKLPPKTPAYLAALSALRNHETDPRVKDALAAARKSRDAEISQAATHGAGEAA